MTSPTYGNVVETDFDVADLGDTTGIIPASPDPEPKFSDPVIRLSEAQRDRFTAWLDDWIEELEAQQAEKQTEWRMYEDAYRSRPGPSGDTPFIGHNTDTIPVVAMAVEPVHARLETGIFKQDPFARVKAIKKRIEKYRPALEKWFQIYFTKVVNLQQIAAPALLECTNLGTAVYKVPYVLDRCESRYYDRDGKVVSRVYTKFRGPKPQRVPLGDFLFPPGYSHLQDCPVVIERQPTTISDLQKLEYNGQLANTGRLKGATGQRKRTDLEDAREDAAGHHSTPTSRVSNNEVVVYECWFSYDFGADEDDDRPDLDSPESTKAKKVRYPLNYVATYHPQTKTILQLRYNPYRHQLFPYVVTPYTIRTDSLYGVGIGEMAYTFQQSITAMHRNAVDNTYIANCRMFVAKKNSMLGERPKIMAGKWFWVDDVNDIRPFQMGDVYHSTISERQNLFGMVEKRTGVSDYMTGRESPALGSRATATSTLALIQEGTRRVEQVTGNQRAGFNEMFLMCLSCWAQFGLGDVDDYIFGDDETGALLDEFFKNVINEDNIHSLLSIDIGITDATTNRQVQQQMQLALIQLLNGYLTQVLQAGQLAIQAQGQGLPQVKDLVVAILDSAQVMYKDLIARYDIPNAEDYLPDVIPIIQSAQGGAGGPPGAANPAGGLAAMGIPPGVLGGGAPGGGPPAPPPGSLGGANQIPPGSPQGAF